MQVEMIKPVDKKTTFGSSEESKMSAAKIEDGVDKFTKGADAVADGIEKTNDSVNKIVEKGGSLGATAGGIFTFLKNPFLTLINWMKKDAVDKNGEKIIEIIDGSEVVKRVWNKNKVIGVSIAAGVAVAGVAAALISKAVKAGKAKKEAEAAEKANQEQANAEAAVKQAEAEAEKAKAEAEKAKAEAEKAKAEAEAEKVEQPEEAEKAA